MTTLHLVFSREGLAACEVRRGEDDVVLLIGDGTLAASTCDHLVLTADAKLHGLGNTIDLKARGVSSDAFVELTTQHNPIVSWP